MLPSLTSHRYLCRISIAALLLALGSPLPAFATDYTWTGLANTPTWSNSSNWAGNLTPIAGADTRLIFGAGNGKSSRNNLADGFILNAIQFTASGYNVRGESLRFVPSSAGIASRIVQTVVGTNTVENNLSFASLLAADIQDSNGNLVLSGALSGTNTTLTKTGQGKLTLRSSTNKTFYQLNINGGIVAVTNNATLNTTDSYIGRNFGSTGTITVDGAGSKWNNSSGVVVGDSGTGTLALTNGGLLTTSNANLPSAIAQGSGSTGTVTIDGTGSKWNSGSDAYVGYAGTGTITIIQGGTFSLFTGIIGLQQGSQGSATIDGAGSQWNSTGDTYVGYNGTGTLAITAGGTANTTNSYLGQYIGSKGSVTVNGTGSKLNISNDIYVGNYGTGTVTITNGGLISTFNSVLGNNEDSNGSATVDGLGSQWTNSGDTFVGYTGTGTLAITGGGTVNNANTYIALNYGSTGRVTVDGTGSKLNTSSNTYIANSGTGSLSITNGASVVSSLLTQVTFIGNNVGSQGTVTVDGTKSQWTNKGTTVVGESGKGTLNIRNEGIVNTGGYDNQGNYRNAFIGNQSGSIGTVNVSGQGSTWTNATDLYLGNSGTGTLAVTDGGYASSFNTLIAYNAGSTGNITVDGTDSKVDVGGQFYIGLRGTGTLAITNGGRVDSFNSEIAGWSGSTGSVTVRGAGSLWNNFDYSADIIESYFSLGSSGTGNLLITDGGRVNSTNTFMAEGSASQGNATVTGTDSLWNIRKVLYIGYSGTGTLNITNGGTVTVGTSTYINGLSLLSANAGTFNTDTLTGNGKIALTGSGLTLNQASDSTFDGTISGTGNLTKTGAGILTLTTSNTNTGNTTIKQGGITLSTGNFTGKRIELQNSGNLKLTDGATLDLGASGQLRPNTGSTVTYDNATITGGLIYGPGLQSVTGTGATFIGTRFLNSSNLTTNTNTDLIGVVNGGTITATGGATVNLDGFVNDFANNITGNIIVENSATVKASDFGSSGKLTVKTGGTFTNTGNPPLVFGGGSQTYIGSKETPGGTLDSGSKDILLNGGLLVNNGEVTGGGTLNIGYGSTVKGAGDFTGVTVNVADGGIFSPGNSPGTATAGDMIWGAGGAMLWEINDATGVAGTGYDFTDLSGNLTIQSGSTPNSKFTISLSSLLSNDTGGALANFDPTQNYTWTLLHADDGVFGFSSTDVTLNTQLFDVFNPGVLPEHFSVEINDKQDTLQINYVAVNVVVPESNTSLLLFIGIGTGAGYLLLRTRRIPSQEN